MKITKEYVSFARYILYYSTSKNVKIGVIYDESHQKHVLHELHRHEFLDDGDDAEMWNLKRVYTDYEGDIHNPHEVIRYVKSENAKLLKELGDKKEAMK